MRLRRLSTLTLVFLTAAFGSVRQTAAQQQAPPVQSDDVVKVNTSLVQTDVMVFDKQGKFVPGLQRDQFVLKIDEKTRDISFFEQVQAGSRNEEAQLAAARGSVSAENSARGAIVPLDRGRTVFFFIDDVHLSASSIYQARQMLTRYVAREMGQNDEVAITSTTGQIGFLQQVTDDRVVLEAAIERLRAQPNLIRDSDRPAMSEYQAQLIDSRDRDVLGFFVDALIRQFPGTPRSVAEDMVRSRASQIIQQSVLLTRNTLATLESLVNTSAALPGRKVIFFVSDGFLIDTRNSDTIERLRKVTSAAAHSGVVVYSIDARGLVAPMSDASTEGTFDPGGRLVRSSLGEMGASQDGMNALARDTGGRPFFNRNDLSAALSTALKESSVYYLLAWRPETEEQRNSKFRHIEVTVAQRPELTVRFRSGVGGVDSSPPNTSAKSNSAAKTPKTPADDLNAALRSVYPRSGLPVALSLSFLNVPERGSFVSASIRIGTDSKMFDAAGVAPKANVDLLGIVFDDHGKVMGTFDQRLTIEAKSGASIPAIGGVYYNQYVDLKPGLYQVRVAARDAKEGRTGSAMHWIQIPDLTSKAVVLSSLIVGEKTEDLAAQQTKPQGAANEPANPFGPVRLSVDHHFARSSNLRFLVFAYSAVRTNGPEPPIPTNTTPAKAGAAAADVNSSTASITGPDLAVQIQVLRDREPVITSPLRKISTEGAADPTRIPYAAELNLEGLAPGHYLLQVTVIDRLTKTSSSQQFRFQVD